MHEGPELRILLVEDCPADRLLVQRLFRDPLPLPGRTALEVVADAEAALTALRRERFSLVLTDYTLPGRSGLDLLRELRAARDETPVVVLTGTGDEAVAVAALQEGAADYVVKQLGYERTLPVVMERALRRRQLELEVERARRQAAEHARRLERQVEEQTALLRRTLRESEALRRVGGALAASREIRPALDLVTRAAAELLAAHAAAALIRADDGLVLASAWGRLSHALGVKSPALAEELAAGWPESAEAPLRDGQAEIGRLWAGRARPDPFSVHDAELLEALADLAGLGIANVRAHEQLRRPPASAAPAGPQAAAPAAPPSAPARVPPRAVEGRAFVIHPFPPVLARLVMLAEDDAVAPEAVEEAVGLDAALTVRVMQLSGAAGLGRARPASSLREALVVLGLRAVRNLAFAQFARGQLARGGPLQQLLWEQSIAAAAGAQLVLDGRDAGLAEDGYLCGLLHTVGAVALEAAEPEAYADVVERAIVENRPFSEIERETFGYSAAAVTEELAERWHLPARVAKVLGRAAVPGGAGFVALRGALAWARARALAANPAWPALLRGRDLPPWVVEEGAAADRVLGLSVAAASDLWERTVARCALLRELVS